MRYPPQAMLVAALLICAASITRAQQSVDSTVVPARPKLDPAADTNSAQANFMYGMKMVNENPEEAVRAFYWASRIDPSSGDALYALRSAKLIAMSDSDLASYMGYKNKKRSPEQLALDSLIYRAYTVNPFLFSSIDGAVMRRTIEAGVAVMQPKMKPALRKNVVAQQMSAAQGSPWMAYTDGRFQDALREYATQLEFAAGRVVEPATKNPSVKEKRYVELRRTRRNFAEIEMHAQRARIFYLLHEMDSASTDMTAAIDLLQANDSSGALLFYQSKAMFEQALGMIYEHERRPDLAREAYGQALQEDLSFYAAHGRIAHLELEQGDTAGALSEMDLAVQLEPADPALRYRYAELLVHARRDADAAQQLRKAIALDPYYGAPHLLLATIGDLESYMDDAVAEYQRYVALANRTDPQLPRVKMRLAKLMATVASSKPN